MPNLITEQKTKMGISSWREVESFLDPFMVKSRRSLEAFTKKMLRV